jgi:formylglycine-generating enzyme required for sulfatase activity
MWYEAALGTPDNLESCALSTVLQPTGTLPSCISGSGAYDMIGNVWEYVETPEGMQLPASGYVGMVNEAGIPIEVSMSPKIEYASDYVWSTEKRPFVVIRGGFYGAKEDGGLYSVQGTITPDFSSAAIGFRCVSTL